MSKSCLFLFLCLCRLISSQTFQVVYSFAEVTTATGTVSPGPAPTVPGLTLGTFTAVGVSSNPNASGRFSFTGWDTGAADAQDDQTLYNGTLSAFKYYELAMSVAPGYTLHLQEAGFSVRRSGTGIRHYCVRSGVDGFSENLPASVQTNTRLTVNPDNVFFWLYDNTSTVTDQKGSTVQFGTDHYDLTGEVALRFYAWNAESSGGSFSIDDVSIRGIIADSATISGVKDVERGPCDSGLRQNLSDFVNCGFESIKVFDFRGALVWQNNMPGTPRLSEGIYVVIRETSHGIFRKKIFVHE